MLDVISFIAALCIIALPWLLWARLFLASIEGDVFGPVVVIAALVIGVPTYYYILFKVAGVAVGS